MPVDWEHEQNTGVCYVTVYFSMCLDEWHVGAHQRGLLYPSQPTGCHPTLGSDQRLACSSVTWELACVDGPLIYTDGSHITLAPGRL
jgi:hypothetical protein